MHPESVFSTVFEDRSLLVSYTDLERTWALIVSGMFVPPGEDRFHGNMRRWQHFLPPVIGPLAPVDHYNDHGHDSGHNEPSRYAMNTIQASEFKAKCLALMDEVARTGEPIVITKNGRPVAELRPHRAPRAKSPFGLHKGKGKILGDIVSPVGTDLWEAMK